MSIEKPNQPETRPPMNEPTIEDSASLRPEQPTQEHRATPNSSACSTQKSNGAPEPINPANSDDDMDVVLHVEAEESEAAPADANAKQVFSYGPPLPVETPNTTPNGSQASGELERDWEGQALALLTVQAQQIDERIASGVQKLQDMFERKLAYDATKDQQVARLHEELTGYRNRSLDRAVIPLMRGVIQLHTNIGKLCAAMRSDPARTQDALSEIEGIQTDLEVVLEQHGAALYRHNGGRFDPHRQRVHSRALTEDANLDGMVAERLRPGFEYDDTVLQKEAVVVYVYQQQRPNEINSTVDINE